jgi:hypothetical protein
MSLLLKDALAHLTVPDLKDLASHLPGEKPTRKDELVDHIATRLLGADVQAIWSGLDEMQRLAVAECMHHPCGEYSAELFRAKYGSEPAFVLKGVKSHGYSGNRKSALGLFVHYVHEDRCNLVPSDLRDRLRGFVPPPPAVTLGHHEALAEEEGQTQRLGEREALQEVLVMLRTIEQTRIQVSEKTALPSTAGLQALTRKLVGGDFYPWVEKQHKWDQEIGPIRAFAWPMLLQAGGLVTRTGNRLSLTPTGIKALSAPPADVLRGLWRKWLKTTLLDEFSRVDAIKGQGGKGRIMTAVAPRREAITEALRLCPAGRWVAVDEFSRFMRATNVVFEVAHDPWSLYVYSRDYGSLGYDGYGGWNILQERYILALLLEYAATLGIVDVAFRDPEGARGDFRGMWGTDELRFLSRYDGLCAFRLTPLGAYVLGLEADYQPAAVAGTATLSVLPSLRINVTGGELGPEESLLLENWAAPLQPGSWQLDRERSLAAIEKGHDIGELTRLLEGRDDMPLPEMVESFIKKCAHDGKALRLRGSAFLVECRDPQTADAIAGHQETSSLCLAAGPKMLVVRSEHLEKFRERVRLLGFGMPL